MRYLSFSKSLSRKNASSRTEEEQNRRRTEQKNSRSRRTPDPGHPPHHLHLQIRLATSRSSRCLFMSNRFAELPGLKICAVIAHICLEILHFLLVELRCHFSQPCR